MCLKLNIRRCMCIVHGCTYVPQPGSYVYTLCGEQTKQNRERETGCNELFVNTENVSGGREAGGIVNSPTPVGKHSHLSSNTDMISQRYTLTRAPYTRVA